MTRRIPVERIIIIGAGGFGREVLAIIRDAGKLAPAGFLDADPQRRGAMIDGCAVLGRDDMLTDLKTDGVTAVFVAVADPRLRKDLFATCRKVGLNLPGIVHPKAYLADTTVLGEGSILYPAAVVMPGCRLGDGVLINAGATVGHDCRIGSFCNLNPGVHVGGRVVLQEGAFIGLGASLRERITVGEYATIGAGSVVLNDVGSHAICFGVPARERTAVTTKS